MSFIQFVLSFIIAAFIIIITMINIMALWKLFKKAGELGWTSLIPFYNCFIFFKIIGMNPWWLCITLVIYYFQNFLFFCATISPFISLILLPFTLFSMITIWYVVICSAINLSRSFKKDSAFSVGLIFIPCIFLPILAFENNQYIGPNPIHDFIFTPKNKTCNIKYCLGCGKKVIDPSMKFCTNCGNCLITDEMDNQKLGEKF